MAEEITYELGKHVKIDDELWLVVRYCDSVTLFEEPTTSTVYTEKEHYWELRNKTGEAKFVQIFSKKTEAQRVPGPIKGIKPYFWKVA